MSIVSDLSALVDAIVDSREERNKARKERQTEVKEIKAEVKKMQAEAKEMMNVFKDTINKRKNEVAEMKKGVTEMLCRWRTMMNEARAAWSKIIIGKIGEARCRV
ncbi:MAG TPA: hypothetical protein ACFYD6_11230 [Candidatus Brocadiia bacterium]|nr:hypothetical protein [Planctomycetota bacterium]MDO8092996.1 hypothetical protein [Candidatus Brocadiales bacterium]